MAETKVIRETESRVRLFTRMIEIIDKLVLHRARQIYIIEELDGIFSVLGV